MKFKPLIIVPGEPNSIFFEILFKSIKFNKIKSPIIVISSKKILNYHLKKMKYNFDIKVLSKSNIKIKSLNNKKINLIDVEYVGDYKFELISKKTKKYIHNCFEIAFELIKKKVTYKFINGPISKKFFLEKKFLGMTEYISKKFNIKNFAMLIYNEKLSVCPITTHLPLKQVAKQINKKIIINKVRLIDNFYKNYFKKKPKIAIIGLNPHCETVDRYNEDEKIIYPAIQILKRGGIHAEGPFPADTLFLKKNRSRFNVIVGMYHDQVLTPIKALFEFDAINVTLGLPFLRISPDHGPNEKMIGKNLSSAESLIKAIKFLDK